MELPDALIGDAICRGTILHSDIFEGIDHGKFFVVMGVSASEIVGFFFINSNINKALWNKAEQLAMQYPVKSEDYSFLRYQSFVCATALKKVPKVRVTQSIAQGRTQIVGSMLPSDMDSILEACRESRLFSKAEKRDFLS